MQHASLLPALFCLLSVASLALADDAKQPGVAEQLDAVKKKLAGEKYELRYKFVKGEVIRWKVTHLATTEMTAQSDRQTSKSRSVSTKAWKVAGTDDKGNLVFINMVESVDMWQQLQDGPQISYNSKRDATPPPTYETVAASLGKPLSVITISPHGKVVAREDRLRGYNLGLGQVTMPLPDKPVSIGHRWFWPDSISIRLQDRRVKKIKTRQSYKLESVKTGVATISMRTEVLTPVRDANVKSQLVQRLTRGTVKFDIDAGRLLSKQIDWDETVVGMGPNQDGVMQYLARFTEQLLPSSSTASGSGVSKDDESTPTAKLPVKGRDDKPLLRR